MANKKLRPSPTESAQEHPDEIMTGNDGEEYVSKKDKNGVYKWQKITWKNTAEEYYFQFPKYYENKNFYKYDVTKILKKLEKVKAALKKQKIYLIEVGWKNVYNFTEYGWDEMRKKLMKNVGVKNSNGFNEFEYNFLYYTEKDLFWANHKGTLHFSWNLTKDAQEEVNKIMREEFGKNYIPAKKRKDTIAIKLPKK